MIYVKFLLYKQNAAAEPKVNKGYIFKMKKYFFRLQVSFKNIYIILFFLN